MSKVNVLGVGDLVMEAPNIVQYFEPVKEILRDGGISIGHVETPHTKRGQICNTEPRTVPAAPPENLDAMKECGFDVASYGGNHTFDHGYYGVMDTLNYLNELGIKTCGAGENNVEARVPAFIERDGLKFAFLEYDCVGPNLSWATPMKAGAAFVRVLTYYESDLAEPGAMPAYCWTFVDPWSLQNMIEDITKVKDDGYIPIVALHIGRMYDPHLLPYEKVITHCAVDAGAQMVMCHHAHEPRGVSVYKGVPIFHNLGNFVTLTSMMNFNTNSTMTAQSLYQPYEYQGVNPVAWKRDCKDVPHETGIPNYVFSHASRNTMICKATFDETGLVSAGFIPCYISDNGSPTPVNRDGKGTDVLNHYIWLNQVEELDDTIFSWNEDGTEVIIRLD